MKSFVATPIRMETVVFVTQYWSYALNSFLFVVLIFGLTIFVFYARRPIRSPPGPPNFPFIGYWLGLKNPHAALIELEKRFGKIYFFNAGTRHVVVISDRKLIMEVLNRSDQTFVDRPHILFENPSNTGLLTTNGPLWKEQRKFAAYIIAKFHHRKYVNDECDFLVQAVDSFEIQKMPCNLKSIINCATGNIVTRLLLGNRNDYGGLFKQAMSDINLRIANQSILSALAFQSWFWLHPGFRKHMAAVNSTNDSIGRFVAMELDKCLKIADDEDINNSYAVAFLTKLSKGEGNHFSEKQLLSALFSALMAGTDTTAATLHWAIYLCCCCPEKQDKVFEEIASKIGKRKIVCEDHTTLPYTCALVFEVHRFASVIPIFAREATEDTMIGSFDVCKGTAVLFHVWSMHRDSDMFPCADEFQPERFLDANGGLREKNILPFGVGKRACIGARLAFDEIFAFIATLLQNFRFEFADTKIRKPTRGQFGGTCRPDDFEVVITRR